MIHLRDRLALVTGGAGFIGSHLVDGLLEAGARVRVLDDLSTGRPENLAHADGRFEMVVGDIRDLAVCRQACTAVDFVFHQAALGSVPRSLESPTATIAVNVLGSANVLEAARREEVSRVVYASSSSVYGDSPVLPRVEGAEGRPVSPYAASKQMTERLAGVFATSYGLQVVGLRYFNVYGPRQSPEGPYAAVIPCFFRELRAHRAPLIHGDGGQTRDFTFVGDAVRANLLAAGALADEVSGDSFNVATGHRTEVRELARRIAELLDSKISPEHGPARPGDVRHAEADLTRAAERLGYHPTIELLDGLRSCRDEGPLPQQRGVHGR